MIRLMAEVGIAIHVPILLQRITPRNPGTGMRVASLYFHPDGSMPNSSQTAKPDTSI